MQTNYIKLSAQEDSVNICLLGTWSINHLSSIQSELNLVLKQLPFSSKINVIGSELEALDTSGAWVLLQGLKEYISAERKIELMDFKGDHQRLYSLLEKLKGNPREKFATLSFARTFFQYLGQKTLNLFTEFNLFILHLGQVTSAFCQNVVHPKNFRVTEILDHFANICLKTLPLAFIITFLVSIILGYQAVNFLKVLGSQALTIDLIILAIVRDMGALFTAIIVAARSGSSFASAIGIMKTNEELAALETLGLNAYTLIVLPRILAITLALPILVFIADIAGLIGAGVVSVTLLDLNYAQFLVRLQQAAVPTDFMVGLIKAPMFGLLIGLISSQKGIQVANSANLVSFATTQAVVKSIFWIAIMDVLLSICFALWGF